MALHMEIILVVNISFEHMCLFQAGGVRASENDVLLWRAACGLERQLNSEHVERRKSGLGLQLPSGLRDRFIQG